MANRILEVNDLRTRFHIAEGTVHAVNGVSFSLNQGETLAIVGESGCGKSVTMLSILGLIPIPPGEIASGEAKFNGHDLLKLTEPEMEQIRGKDIAMIFQDPMTALNPVLSIGRQLGEPLRVHLRLEKEAIRQRSIELLEQVGIPDPVQRLSEYPHQLSGGQRQRTMIAMALACFPSILIADEPTTALDVTIQAQIVELVQRFREKMDMAVIWITHDLGVVAEMAERVLVMYAGSSSKKPWSITCMKTRAIPTPRRCWLPCRASTSAGTTACAPSLARRPTCWLSRKDAPLPPVVSWYLTAAGRRCRF